MSRFQIMSDLHIEFKKGGIVDPLSLIKPTADILILAGDIGSLYKLKQLEDFLTKVCTHFESVLYVPGNHEYYIVKNNKPTYFTQLSKRLYALESKIKNLYILNRTSVRIGDVCIVGCTLWSKPLVKIPKFIVRIAGMTTEKYEKMFNDDVNYIQRMIKYCKEKNLKLLVVTHHCPTYDVIQGKKKKDKFISLYASELDHLLKREDVHTWVCGHIHQNFDYITEGGTRLVGNQRGKPKDNIRDFEKNKVIEIK